MSDKGGPPGPTETELSAGFRRRLHFRSESLPEPLGEQLTADARIDVESVVQLDDGTNLQYWTVSHRDPDRLIETVERLPETRDATLLRSVDDTHRFEVHGARASLFGVFDEYEATTQWASYDADGFDVVVAVPAAADIDAVVSAVQDRDPDIQLVDSYTVETLDAVRSLVREHLTERQQTVLQLAYERGYYEQPRRRSGTELAAQLGISRQAFHDHLRKAHRTVFDVLLEDGASPPEVDT